jgi:HEAT repeat protein
VLGLAGLGGLLLILNLSGSEEPAPPVVGPVEPKPGGSPKEELETPRGLVEVLAVSEDLNESKPAKRIAALLALGRAGEQARAVLPALIEALKDEDPEVRIQAQAALDKIGPPTSEDLPVLSLALQDEAPEVRAFAAGAVAQLGLEARDELPTLTELADDEDALVSAAAQKAREKLEKLLLAELTRRLKEEASADARREAARELGDIGPDASSAVPSLTEALGDPNSAVRQAASEALVQVGPEVVPVLIQTLKDENVAVRSATISALARFGPDAQEAVPALLGLADDRRIGTEVVNSLVVLGEDAVPAMVRVLVIEQVPARVDLLVEILVKIGPGALPAIEYALLAPRPEIRGRLTRVVERIGPVKVVTAQAELTGQAGVIYNDLRGLFDRWDHGRRGYLDRMDLDRAFRAAHLEAVKANPKAKLERPESFLRRLDRDGDGKVSRAEYERWARGHAEKLHQENLAREKLRTEQNHLKKDVKTHLAQNQAEAVRARKEAQKHTQEIAEAKRRVEQQEKAHKEAEHRAREQAEARKKAESQHKQAEAKAHAEKEHKARQEAQRHAEAREKERKVAQAREKELHTRKAQAAAALGTQQKHAKAAQAQAHANLAKQQRAQAANQHRAGYQAHVAAVDRHVQQPIHRPPPAPPRKRR